MRTMQPPIAFLAAAAALGAILPVAAQQAPAVVGHWLSEARDGVIDIEPCGSKLCGTLIWIKDPLDKNGKPLVDDKNPKPELRSRRRCNLVMMGDFVSTGTNEWGDGWIYDPTSGKTYDAKMRLDGDQLRLRGFVGISLFGASQTWLRADPSLENCGKG
jgi:uncharacterized protein (DUF2147 family)